MEKDDINIIYDEDTIEEYCFTILEYLEECWQAGRSKKMAVLCRWLELHNFGLYRFFYDDEYEFPIACYTPAGRLSIENDRILLDTGLITYQDVSAFILEHLPSEMMHDVFGIDDLENVLKEDIDAITLKEDCDSDSLKLND